MDWNGTELATQDVEYGKAATAPANPKRDGYTFTSWDKAFNNITGTLTVTAQYKLNFAIEAYAYAYDTQTQGLLIVDAASLAEGKAYAVNGEKMYYTTAEAYTDAFTGCTGVYVYIVSTSTTENALSVVDKAAGYDLDALKLIGDINDNGRTDISDANAIYQMLKEGQGGGYYTEAQLGVKGRLIADMVTGTGSAHGGLDDADAILKIMDRA